LKRFREALLQERWVELVKVELQEGEATPQRFVDNPDGEQQAGELW